VISAYQGEANTVDFEKAARLNIELGLNYLKQGQTSRAKSKLNRAKRLAPNLSEVHYAYAFFHEQVGEAESAEKEYLKAISLKRDGGNEHNNYGTFLCRQQRYKDAEKQFLLAVEDPNYNNTAEAYENAGLCVLQKPDVARAVEYFEKALRYDQNRSNALLELAIIRFKEKNIQQAQAYFNLYAQAAKPTARSLLLGIELAKLHGDKNKEASYRMLLRSFPDAKHASLLTGNKKLS
jgi:type IV pilus assembly protein PilF